MTDMTIQGNVTIDLRLHVVIPCRFRTDRKNVSVLQHIFITVIAYFVIEFRYPLFRDWFSVIRCRFSSLPIAYFVTNRISNLSFPPSVSNLLNYSLTVTPGKLPRKKEKNIDDVLFSISMGVTHV